MKVMAGIDLHSNNALCALMDIEGNRLGHRKLPNKLEAIDAFLEPYRERIDTVAVESTFNWYWLVDGLQDAGWNVVLANPGAMQQYSGLKHTDDVSDAYFLTELLRLNILPQGHIANRQWRPVRDLARRRMLLVGQRTQLILSFKSLNERTLGRRLSSNQVKAMSPVDAAALFIAPADCLLAREEVALVAQISAAIGRLEKAILKDTRRLPRFKRLQTIPGIGDILGLTIALESDDPKRFASAGEFASYCRCVKSQRQSNDKNKGRNNRKCGNKYLSWAFVEAAHFSRRFDDSCRRFYDRKKQRVNTAVATKALACKLAKAAWHVMTQDVDYDGSRVFGGGK